VICVDTNILIYASKGLIDPEIFRGKKVIYSSVVKIEALGYKNNTQQEVSYLKVFFDEYEHYYISDEIVQKTIEIRINNKLKLPDAIIAASAIANDCVLWTVNETDFQQIPKLKLYNPLKKT